MTTEREQILALAVEPVERRTVCAACGGQSLDLKPSYCVCADCGSNRFKVENRYTADQLLAACKPLLAEIERLKTVPMKYRRMEFNAQLQKEADELRQQLAAANARISELEAQGEEPVATVTWIEGICCIEPLDGHDYPVEFTELYLLARKAVPEDGRKGFSIYLGREDWGHVIDGLMLERQRSEQRKSANPDSNSDYIADRCAELIGKINTASAEAMAATPSPEGEKK